MNPFHELPIDELRERIGIDGAVRIERRHECGEAAGQHRLCHSEVPSM